MQKVEQLSLAPRFSRTAKIPCFGRIQSYRLVLNFIDRELCKKDPEVAQIASSNRSLRNQRNRRVKGAMETFFTGRTVAEEHGDLRPGFLG